jgi:hypothetical protein
MNNVTEKTEQLVKPWIATRKRLERLTGELAEAQKEFKAANNALGQWLVPADGHLNEAFNIWYGSGILQATLTNAFDREFEVKWRREPDGKDRQEKGF